MDVVLPKWVAIELVCKIICRFEKRKFDEAEFKEPERLQKFLDRYIQKDISEKIALKVFGAAVHVNRHYSKVPQSRSFHTLISSVRKGREVKLRKEVFKKYKDFIKDKDFGGNLIVERKATSISKKRNELAGKSFEFFYYFKNPEYHTEGVVNGFLKFEFSKVTLTSYEAHSKYFYDYIGSYEVHKIQDGFVLQLSFLTQKLKTAEKEKQINFTICVAEDEFEEAFGVMYQVNPRFECANIIMQKPAYSNFRDNLSIKFNSSSENENSGFIWPLMWEFFMLYKTRYVQEMPILSPRNSLAQFLTDYIEEYKENLYQRNEVRDINIELDRFEEELIKHLSRLKNTIEKKKLLNHFLALKEAYSISNLERGINSIIKEGGNRSSWFRIYFLSILDQMK